MIEELSVTNFESLFKFLIHAQLSKYLCFRLLRGHSMVQEQSQHVVVLLFRVKLLFHLLLGHPEAMISVATPRKQGLAHDLPHKFSRSCLIFARRGPEFLNPISVEKP